MATRARWLVALVVVMATCGWGAGGTAGAARTGFQADAAVMSDLMARARAGESVAGPTGGVLRQANDRITVANARVALRDFYASVRFTNPTDSGGRPWDYGFGFRDGGSDQQYRLILDSSSVWFQGVRVELSASGSPIAGYDPAPGAENLVDLVVAGAAGYFAVNGAYVATLDLSEIVETGDIWVGTAFFPGNTTVGATTPYAGFEVWSLDSPAAAADATPVAAPEPTPVAGGAAEPDADAATFARARDEARSGASEFGPSNGELVQVPGQPAISMSGIDIADFYARVRFVGPVETGGAGWDAGFVFRDQGNGEQFRLIVDTTGTWYLAVGAEPAFASGPAPTLDLGPGGVNTLELVARDGEGYFAINGAFVARLDLAGITEAGDLWFGTAFFAESTVEGAVTRYRDFEVWPLAGAVASAPTPATGTAGETTAVRLAERDGSGVSGLALLTVDGERVAVVLTVAGGSGEELALIHEGTCAALDPTPAFLLRDPGAAGRSETTIAADLAALTESPHAVVLRASAAAYGTVVACGEIVG